VPPKTAPDGSPPHF